MKLDRFTEKAQEAIVVAQRLATDAQSPVLDAEHLLAALLQDPEGIPAVTLRALGADPSAVALVPLSWYRNVLCVAWLLWSSSTRKLT